MLPQHGMLLHVHGAEVVQRHAPHHGGGGARAEQLHLRRQGREEEGIE